MALGNLLGFWSWKNSNNTRNLLLYLTGFCLHRHFQIEWFTLLFPPVEEKHYEGNLIQIFMSNDMGGRIFSGSGGKNDV